MNTPTSQAAGLAFRHAVDAMPQAEGLGGCNGVGYIQLMEAISRTALERATAYAAEIHRETLAVVNGLTKGVGRERVVRLALDQLQPVARRFGISVDEVQAICSYHESRP